MKTKLLLCLITFLGLVTNLHSQTGCATTFPVPFHEGFNSDSATQSCWTVVNSNGDADAWDMNYTSNPFEGDQSAILYTDLNSGNNNDWLISPTILLTGNEILRFRYRVQSDVEANVFRIMISTTGTNPSDFTSTLVPLTSYNNIYYMEQTVNLAAYQGAVNIAWNVPNGGPDGWRLYIDDVNVEVVPTCPKPTGLDSSATTGNSTSLSWTNGGTETAWEVLTVPCGAPAPTSNDVGVAVSTNPYQITGLSAFTCYTTYIRAVCSATDKSAWNTITFTTLVSAPGCGGQFVDSGGVNGNYSNLSDETTTICPNNAGDVVTVTFTSFNTEAGWDAMYVYDGPTASSPQIVSSYAAGNGPASWPGGFWGSSIPGPFTSSSLDGCLTFRFRSDTSVTNPGWIANVTCAPPPSCINPSGVTSSNPTQTSITLAWTDSNSATSWEVLALPMGSPTPSPTASGQVVTSNPAVITGLTMGTIYSFYVRALCPAGDFSYWSSMYNAATLITNDECVNAIVVPVNGHNCAQAATGSLTGATASSEPLVSPCIGAADDDVWYKFVATNPVLNIALNANVTTANLNFAVYSGNCGTLSSVFCSAPGSLSGAINNLTVGSTYYVRVYSNANIPQTTSFTICITVPSSCTNSESICGINSYANTTGVSSIGTIGCLFTTPNPTFFTVKIAESGPVNLLLTQSTNGTTPNLDVDYAAWGPFTDQTAACNFIGSSAPFAAPGIGGNPVTETSGCSYSTIATENLNIPNAQAGEYYILLVTNFSNQAGFITIAQSNVNDADAGSIDCSGIRLNAFIDSNANGTQDSGEPNFPLGQFHYEINNDGSPHSIISPSGSYMIYDQNLSNAYNLSYTINSDYSSLYTTTASYANVSVSAGAMTTYNFPITSVQNYTDLGVTLVPLASPRAGASYKVKVIYTNNGTQTIPASTLTFNSHPVTTITDISQVGTTPITNGFTYGFTNLLPYESRSIIVSLSVPSIPSVYLGQLLTNTASITPPSGDLVANNDSNSATQAIIGSYDPNDKVETHGEEILFSSFASNDYLEYTIRFENSGTAAALNVSINDILDNQLDESSLVMLASSHSYSLDRSGHSLIWNFSNIHLPVSVTNTDIGKGFVKFKIKPKPGYAIGDIIPNTAQIYFDSNPAIVTNTFNTKFVAELGTELFTEDSILLYPNPAKNLVQVTIQNSTEIIANITIYDILGKKVTAVSNVASNQSTVDVSNLSKGVYLIEIKTESHLKQIKKLIIQ